MPFGRRRFQSLIRRGGGELHAYFLPLDDLSAPAEYVTEEALRREIASNTEVSAALGEELLALKAFERDHPRKSELRAALEKALARSEQRTIIDVLEPQERAITERFRGRILGSGDLSRQPSSIERTRDLERDVLQILDTYFPKGT